MVTYGYILYIIYMVIYGYTWLDMIFWLHIYIYPLRLELHFQVG